MQHKTMTTALLLTALATPALAQAQDDEANSAAVEAAIQAQARAHRQDAAEQAAIRAQQALLELTDRPAQVVVQPNGDGPWTELRAEHVKDNALIFVAQPRHDPMPAAPMVRAAFLGVNCEPLDADTAKLLGVDRGTGLLVGFVVQDSPAAAAGLAVGDVITRLDDQLLVNAEQLAVLVRTFDAGDAVTLHVLREGEPVELTAELAEREVAELGPGGANLDQQWRVQQNRPIPAAPLPPGMLLHRLDPDALAAQEVIERMQQNGLDLLREIPEIGPLFQDGQGNPVVEADLRAMIEQMQQQMRRQMEQVRRVQQQQRREMELMMQQIREQLDLDLQQLHEGMLWDDDKDGVAQADRHARSELTMNDGEHVIWLKTHDMTQHLTVTDRAGNVLYDGLVPTDDRHKVFEEAGLSIDVQQKIDRLLAPDAIPFDF